MIFDGLKLEGQEIRQLQPGEFYSGNKATLYVHVVATPRHHIYILLPLQACRAVEAVRERAASSKGFHNVLVLYFSEALVMTHLPSAQWSFGDEDHGALTTRKDDHVFAYRILCTSNDSW